jgi:tetratricopeptide (TPR) repeat protein
MQGQELKFTRLAAKFFALLSVAVLLAAPGVFAQATSSKQQPAPKPAAGDKAGAQTGAADASTPPVNKAEEDAARAILGLKQQDSAQVIAQAEDFLTKYPGSQFRDSIYARLAHAYFNSGRKEKMFSTGELALKENPNNVDVLSLLAYYVHARYSAKALDAEQILEKSEEYARHGLEVIALVQKPDYLSEEEFERSKNADMAMCQSGLGKVYYFKGKDAAMVEAFEKSTALDPTPDPLDFFLLGSGATRLKKYPEAANAFERCSASPWVWQEQCKGNLAKVKPLADAQAASAPAPAQPAPAAAPDKPKPPR